MGNITSNSSSLGHGLVKAPDTAQEGLSTGEDNAATTETSGAAKADASTTENGTVTAAPVDNNAAGAEATAGTGAKPRAMTLAEKIAEKKQRSVKKNTRTRPLLRKLGNDFSRTLPGWTRDAVLVDSYEYTDEGVFVVAPHVADYVIQAGRAKTLFDAELRIAITIMAQTFVNYSKIDGGDAASAYADAVAASETEWVWITWEHGAYNWSVATEEIKEPVWPVDRTPDELYASMLAGRFINDINHHVIERIVLGKR
jgi:hypothetical protein